MREITSRGDCFVDDQSLIEYSTNGIPDLPTNKVILYACKTLAEFKDKLKIYEKIFNTKSRNVTSFQNSAPMSDTKCYNNKFVSYPTHSKSENKSKDKDIIWYNCSERSYISHHCPNLYLGPKCQICLNFGHKSYMCPNKLIPKAFEKETISIVKFSQPNLMHKSTKMHHVPLTALVNTGSDATIFNIHAYNKLGSSALKNYSGMLTAFGNSKINHRDILKFL